MEGLNYIRATPLVFWIGMVSVGWASGGGAAQILFTLFGEQVFHRGAAGIGTIWGFAGLGLLIGGWLGHVVGRRTGFAGYKRTISISYIIHGITYVAFSQMRNYALALGCICLSRVGMAVSSVLNYSQLLRHTGPLPRPGILHHGIAALGGDDRIDGAGGYLFAILQPASDRHGSGNSEFVHRGVLDVGGLERTNSGA